MDSWLDNGLSVKKDLAVFGGHELDTSVTWQVTMLMQRKS